MDTTWTKGWVIYDRTPRLAKPVIARYQPEELAAAKSDLVDLRSMSRDHGIDPDVWAIGWSEGA